MIFGPNRYFVPVSIRHEHGFYGGPVGYEETNDKDAIPIIVDAWREGDIPLSEARDELDRLENQGH